MCEKLFSAVIGDAMDELGYLHQFFPPRIQPLAPHMIVVGRAMPVLEADATKEHGDYLVSKPFGLMLEALDNLKKNEVYVCTGSSSDYALWGELMSTRALMCGAVGAVIDGYSRDTKGILKLDFPTFSHGRYAQDQGPRGMVVGYRVPIEMNGVWIEPGDIIFGDMDGVCVIPQKVEMEVIHVAWKKAKGEKIVQKAIENGMTACEAHAKYGIM